MKNKVIESIESGLKLMKFSKQLDFENLIEIPKDNKNGDFAFPCFILAKSLKSSPVKIAKDLGEKINTKYFEKIVSMGPYINFFLNRKKLAQEIILKIEKEKGDFGKSKIGKGKKVIIEFSSPNIAKPFGIGHLRSTIIGNSIANLAESQGYNIIKLNYLGDWGTQFGKLITGFKKFGSEKELLKDPIQHLYKIYVKVNKDKSLEDESRDWFKKLENGDKEAVKIWKRFRKLSLIEFKKIYSRMGIKFDSFIGESIYNDKMQDVVNDLKEKNILEKSEGAWVVNLEKNNLGISLIQKSDGATLYATRDLASAITRYEEYNFDEMIYEVGQEQKLHFSQLFKILELMGYDWAKNCIHVDHGLYLGEDGKRLATRKGKTVFMEDILDETEDLARAEIKKRFPDLSKEKLYDRGKKIAIAAIFYGDLKNTRTNNIVFDLERFISFEGDTGPYLEYSYARASSILRKKSAKKFTVSNKLEEKELNLILKLNEFKKVVHDAYRQKNPALVANYSYKLSQMFNEFYHICPVIGSNNEQFRLNLVKSFRQVLKNALSLLGIDTLERM